MRVADLVLRGGRVIDPASGRDETADIAFGDGKITEIARDFPASGAQIVEANLRRRDFGPLLSHVKPAQRVGCSELVSSNVTHRSSDILRRTTNAGDIVLDRKIQNDCRN
jgi:hypothetical protein